MGAFVDLTGQRFGRLVVLDRAESAAGGATRWRVRCDCSAEKIVLGKEMRSGRTTSCGCFLHERLVETKTRHGRRASPEYNSWSGILQRCTNPKNPRFVDYGGRGITVCDRWRESFEAFFEDMGPRPSEGHSIDRIDNARGYEPGNCRWATDIEQGTNRRASRLITAHGRTLPLMAWVRESGLTRSVIEKRLARGWAPDDAIPLAG